MFFFKYRFLFIQVENQNLIKNLEYYYYYDMLITCKGMTFCKQLHCDAKNESSYFVITLKVINLKLRVELNYDDHLMWSY